MTGKTGVRVHWSFWAIGAVGLIWNVLGGVNFLMQMNSEVVASLPDTHRAIIVGRPLWATGGFAITVFVGALGCLALLLRKQAAFYLLVASLLGAVVTMIHTVNVAVSVIAFSPLEIFIMIVMPLVVAALLIWYAKQAGRRGWLS